MMSKSFELPHGPEMRCLERQLESDDTFSVYEVTAGQARGTLSVFKDGALKISPMVMLEYMAQAAFGFNSPMDKKVTLGVIARVKNFDIFDSNISFGQRLKVSVELKGENFSSQEIDGTVHDIESGHLLSSANILLILGLT